MTKTQTKGIRRHKDNVNLLNHHRWYFLLVSVSPSNTASINPVYWCLIADMGIKRTISHVGNRYKLLVMFVMETRETYQPLLFERLGGWHAFSHIWNRDKLIRQVRIYRQGRQAISHVGNWDKGDKLIRHVRNRDKLISQVRNIDKEDKLISHVGSRDRGNKLSVMFEIETRETRYVGNWDSETS